MKRTVIIICIVILALQATAQYARKYSNEFLNIGVGARAFGMGNAVVASGTDVNAAYWNPAALARIQDNLQFSLMHSNYYEKIGNYDFVAVGGKVKNNGVLALSFNRFGVDDIVNTLNLVQNGQVDYSRLKTFSATDYAVYISYAQRKQITTKKDTFDFAWGASPKIIYRNVGTFAKAWGFGVDAGLHVTRKHLSVGVMLKDITTTYNTWNMTLTPEEKDVFYQTGNEIPVKSTEITLPKFIPGVAYAFRFKSRQALIVEADLQCTFDGKRNVLVSGKRFNIDPYAGAEYALFDRIFLRAGVANVQNILDVTDSTSKKKTWTMQPNFGIGLKLKNIYLDYALTALGGNSVALNSNIFSVRVSLNKKSPSRTSITPSF